MNFLAFRQISDVNNIRNSRLIKRFGKHLRELRVAKEMSQEALANEADVPISQIGRIERGEINPTLSTLQSLADALKLPMNQLLDF